MSLLFIFVFISIAPSSDLKKILMWFTSKNVLSMFSYKSFIASDLTFRPVTYFGFIFVYGVRECSNFILLHVTVQHHLLKRILFALCSCLVCHRLGGHRCMVYHWNFYHPTLIYTSAFVPVPYCFDEFVAIVWSQGTWFFQLSSSLSRLLWLFKVFVFPYKL